MGGKRGTYTKHKAAKVQRSERFARQVYGVVHEPVLPKNVIGCWDPPGYLAARQPVRYRATILSDGIDRKLDLRCFYTGMPCYPVPARPPPGWDQDPRKLPFMGTRDHLVPARRHVAGCPIDVSQHATTVIYTANIANVTLGLAPLAVRLKVRQWLTTAPYSREDVSVEAGLNLRWLIIHYLNWFRFKDRYPWSRQEDGSWWYPESEWFMARMYAMEQRFLEMDEQQRDLWIRTFEWRY